jgi:TPR repeat protein
MRMVRVTTAAALVGVDRRTVRRWLDDFRVDNVLSRAGLRLSPDDVEVVLRADHGDRDACAELALILQERDLHDRAAEWNLRAAERGHTDAMHWLARAYIDGEGVEQDVNVGVMWLARAASLGHAISAAQIAGMVTGLGTPRR